MNKEEIYTKDKISEHLEKTEIVQSIKEGGDPPDYEVTIGDTIYALEITNAETLSVGNTKRREFEDALFYLAKEANNSNNLKTLLNENTLLIYVNQKIQNYNKFKKALLNEKINDLDSYIESLKQFPEVSTIKLMDKFIDKKPIQFIIGDKNAEIDIQKHINQIVEDIFNKKKIKMDNASINNIRWLGVKVNHYFTGEDFWRKGVKNLVNNYGFSRVFFVTGEGKIFDMQL